jgi:hypothetical protein
MPKIVIIVNQNAKDAESAKTSFDTRARTEA